MTRELVERFAAAARQFVVAADRTSYSSSLFDMSRRTVIGMYCLYDHERWFLEEIVARRDPADLGRSLRRPCSNPQGQLINAIPWTYLVARENEIALGRSADDDTLAWLMEVWAQMASAYRADGTLVPLERENTLQVLEEPDERVLRELVAGKPHDVADVQRMAARLEMMNFVISGEIRGRNFWHGPYAGSESDTVLVVQELTELDHREQPWIEGLLDFPFTNVAVVRELARMDLVFDFFGFMTTGASDYRDQIRRAVVVTVEDGVPRRLAEEELEQIGERAQKATRGGYERIATWDDDFRVEYGIYHYLNDFAPFARAVGAPELIAELRARIEDSAERRLSEVQAMDAVPPGWARLAASEGPFTLPVTA
jgi:hypothetical protein